LAQLINIKQTLSPRSSSSVKSFVTCKHKISDKSMKNSIIMDISHFQVTYKPPLSNL